MKELDRKELPNAKEYPTLPPDMDYIYFRNGDLFPFKIREKNFTLRNAWWLAESAFLAYCHPGFARMAFQLAGLDNFRFFQGKGTECMVAWNKKQVIVSFRGTELNSLSTLHEIGTDLNTIPVDFEKGGKVHQGFLLALDEVWDGPDGLNVFLEERLKEKSDRPMWITGHSLGGALATLCFARIPEAFGLYIYGAPRVGDGDFMKHLIDRPVFRVEHARDPIPLVPPHLPRLDFNFHDTGKLIFLTEEGEVLFEKPVVDLKKETEIAEQKWKERRKKRGALSLEIISKAFKGDDPKDQIQEFNSHLQESREEWKSYFKMVDREINIKIEDHMPIYYTTKLWNQLVLDEESRDSAEWKLFLRNLLN